MMHFFPLVRMILSGKFAAGLFHLPFGGTQAKPRILKES